MARTGVTQQEVFQAASAVRGRGLAVTIQRVREALGQTGSYTTIARYLDEWRAAEAAAGALEAPPGIPEPVEQAMATAIREIWRLAAVEAQREVAAVKDAADRQIKELMTKEGDALEEVRRLEAEAAAAAATIEEQEARLVGGGRQLAAAAAKEEELRSQIQRTEAQFLEMAARISQLEEHARHLEKAKLAAQTEVEHLREQEKLAATAQATSRELREHLKQEQERNRGLEERFASLQVDLAAQQTASQTHERAAAASDAACREVRERLAAELERIHSQDAKIVELTKLATQKARKGGGS